MTLQLEWYIGNIDKAPETHVHDHDPLTDGTAWMEFAATVGRVGEQVLLGQDAPNWIATMGHTAGPLLFRRVVADHGPQALTTVVPSSEIRVHLRSETGTMTPRRGAPRSSLADAALCIGVSGCESVMTGRGPSGHAGIAAGAIAAAELATAAGEILLEIRSHGASGDALGAAGDAGSQDFIAAELVRRFPADAVLSEEATDTNERLTASRIWIIDPLDGTREFSEPPREDWAVHVALVENGTLVHGAVALPAWTHARLRQPAPAPPAPSAAPRFVVSRTRPAADVLRIAHGMGAELVPMGSAGAKAMAVVLGEAEVYAHSGGQYEWDSAAPVAVAQACGLHVSRMDGSRLVYNRPDPYLPDLLICRPEFADDVLAHYRKGLT